MAPTKAGWLTKRGAKRKNWKRRWVVLEAGQQALNYYRAEPGLGKGVADSLGSINLAGCVAVRAADEKTQRQNSFLINAGDRTFFFVADTCDDREEWIKLVGQTIMLRGSSSSGRSLPSSLASTKPSTEYGARLRGTRAAEAVPFMGVPEDLTNFEDL